MVNSSNSVRDYGVRLMDQGNDRVRAKVEDRLYRALNYVSIFVFILIVYGGALITDYLLFQLMWALLSEEIQQYPVVEQAFSFARIGLALMFIAGAVIHGMLSTYSQVRLDISLMNEGIEA